MAFFFRRAAKPAFGPCLTSLPRSPYFRFRSTLGRSLYVHIRRSENHAHGGVAADHVTASRAGHHCARDDSKGVLTCARWYPEGCCCARR